MSPSSFVEEVQLVAQAEPEVPRFERIAILLGLASCAAVLVVGLVLYLVKFQVDHRLVTWALWLAPIAGLVVFFRIRPAATLTPVERMVRSKRTAYLLLGFLTGAAILGSIATATSLHTTEDWLMLAFIMLSPISIFSLINTRFSIG